MRLDASAWLGNFHPVATEHYLQVTDEHFEQAAQPVESAEKAVQNPVRQTIERARAASRSETGENDNRRNDHDL